MSTLLALDTPWQLVAAAALLALLFLFVVAPRWAHKARILWGLRGMRTAPGSLGVPLLGHTYALARGVTRYPCTWDLFSIWSQATAPEPVRVQIFTEQCAVIGDPALMKRVLQTNLKNYAKDLEFSYSPFIDILGTGLVTSEGALWAKQRKLVSNAFRLEILDDIVGISMRAVERLCVKLEKYRGTGTPVEIAEEFRHLTLQVIGESILSLTPEESDSVFPHLYLPIMARSPAWEESNRRTLEPWRTFLMTPEWFRQRRRVRDLNKYIIGMIQSRWKRRQAGEKPACPDMVDRIMDGVEPSEWGPAAEQQLCYEIKTFVLAGHETSAAMLTWSLFELSRTPATEAKVRAEGARVFGDAKKPATREAVDTMDYTLATLKEILRLYSVVPVVTRVAVADDVLGTCHIPAGTRIILSMQGVHHRPDLWPEPMRFKAERFLPGAPEVDPYSFLPFIQGPRNCLGQYLALLEARVVLGVLSQRFKFKAATPETGRIDYKMIPIGPAGGMMLLVS